MKQKQTDFQHNYAKQFFARHGFCRDEFTYDPDYRVRAEIAKLGHNLNILMHDKDWRVRKEVAKQSYGLLTLQNDANKENCQLSSLRKRSDFWLLLHKP